MRIPHSSTSKKKFIYLNAGISSVSQNLNGAGSVRDEKKVYIYILYVYLTGEECTLFLYQLSANSRIH